MNEFERGCESLSKAARDVVDNLDCVTDGPEPKVSAHLFLGEVGSVHFNGGAPCSFHDTVHALFLGGSGNDGRFVLIDPMGGVLPMSLRLKSEWNHLESPLVLDRDCDNVLMMSLEFVFLRP